MSARSPAGDLRDAGHDSETAFELGGALGIAVLGTVLNGAYLELPAGVPGEATSESLAGAVGTAAALPVEQAGQLMRAAQTAFLEGVHLMSLLTAVMLAVVAVLAVVGLRGVPKEIPEGVLAVRA